MDIFKLYNDFSIDYVTEGHKHCRPGYVNIECPLCTGNPGYHLSYNILNNYFICWRCGWHSLQEVLSGLLNIPVKKTLHIIQQYEGFISSTKEVKIDINKKKHKLPSSIVPLTNSHKKYLIDRNYDPNYLEKEWKLLSTTPSSILDHISYKHRILIPIIWNDKQVSFTTRDTTSKSNVKYISCPKNRENIEHKHILYGKQSEWKDIGIAVEGPTDVWRLGDCSFALFGIKYTLEQIKLISKLFKKVFVLFDNDPQAILQAKKLVGELNFRGVKAYNITLPSKYNDPGSMQQNEANYLIKNLIK